MIGAISLTVYLLVGIALHLWIVAQTRRETAQAERDYEYDRDMRKALIDFWSCTEGKEWILLLVLVLGWPLILGGAVLKMMERSDDEL